MTLNDKFVSAKREIFLLNYPSELKLDSGYKIDAFLFMLLLLSHELDYIKYYYSIDNATDDNFSY